ncbi:MAG TPA: glycosyltransferase family 4 protein, partial [Tepidisphaeraceae bacterium]|nr:glycosyltransferase family 4 protein [Tepidisphaeraceae bacterium]
MKVAIVNRPADYVAPGVPEAIAIISIEAGKRLAASCDVVQYCGRFRGQPKTSVIDGMEYRRLPFLQDKPLVALGKLWDKVRDPRRPHYASKLFYPINAHLLARDLRESGCDVAHVHLYPQTVAVIRKYNPRLKIVLHMHCEWLNQLDRAMVEPGVAAADAIVGVSDFISERIREAFPAHADRVHTIYNAVDTARFSVSTERHHPKRILSTARLSPEKGIHVLVQAFNLVHEKAPDVELRLNGVEHLQPLSYYKKLSHDPNLDGLEKYYEGSYSEQLRNLLTPSAASKVIFAGEVDYSQMSGEYSQSDIFVHPSVWNDPSPLVLGEAMSAGVPVVATRVGGQPEIVSHGESGLLVPPNNPQALAGALLMLIT